MLFGVRNDIVEGDLRGAEYALNTGAIRPWTALNFGDIELAPHRKWLMPDPDEDARRKSLAERTTAYNEALEAYKKNGFVIDQAFADKLAADFGIEAPRLALAKPTSVEVFQYDLELGVVTINEARERKGLPPREGGDATVPEARAAAAPAPDAPADGAVNEPAPAPAEG